MPAAAPPSPSTARPDHTPATPDPVVQTLRSASLAALGALVLLGVLWELVIAPTGSGTLALKVLPLVFAFAGLWRHRMYTYRWLSLLVWLYFLEGVTRAWTERGASQAMALLEIALCLVLFAVCTVYIRRRLNVGAASKDDPV